MMMEGKRGINVHKHTKQKGRIKGVNGGKKKSRDGLREGREDITL